MSRKQMRLSFLPGARPFDDQEEVTVTGARTRPITKLAGAALAVAVLAGACGSGGDGKADKAAGVTPTASTAKAKLTIGYSAWPGWFPLAVAESKGLFAKAGLDVDLK